MFGRTSDGTRYLIEGRGRQIVLIHGVGMDLAMWDDVAACLTPEARVIRYDMLGHGESAKPSGPYRLSHFVEQLNLLVTELRLDAFTLVGFSMGGLVAQGYALAQPGNLSRLVLLNTVYSRDPAERQAILQRVAELRNGGLPESVEAAIDRWFTPAFRLESDAVIQRVRTRMLSNHAAGYAAAYEVFATSDAELAPLVRQIKVPTLVITGEDDQRSTAVMTHALAREIQGAQARIIPGQRHLTPLEIPADIAREIVRGV